MDRHDAEERQTGRAMKRQTRRQMDSVMKRERQIG